MTNLQEAYRASALAFAKIVVQGEPAHIMKKLEKCPQIKNLRLNDYGDAVTFNVGPYCNEHLYVQFPKGVRLKKSVEYFTV